MLKCPECGTPYSQIAGGNKQYCSERCRKRAERKRWRAKRKEFEQMSPEEQKQIKDKKEKALFEKFQREESRKAKSKAAFEKKREDARLKREAKKRLKKKQSVERKAKKRAERIRAKEANMTLSWEEKAERLAKARRLRAEKQKQSREWRLKHKAEIRKIELSRKKRAIETRQRVAAMQRERARNKYREMRKPIIAEWVKKGWILCKSVCKECGEEFEYAKRTKTAPDTIFCSPTCNRSYHWKHGKKRKYQAKAQQIARLARRELPGSKWERMLNPNNSVDRIFIYGY